MERLRQLGEDADEGALSDEDDALLALHEKAVLYLRLDKASHCFIPLILIFPKYYANVILPMFRSLVAL